MLRLARFGVPLGVALALVVGAQGSAFAATTNVSIVNFAFNPNSVTIKLGGDVLWTNNAVGTTHTSTADGIDPCCTSGSALWNSSSIPAGTTFDFIFHVAGTYTYHCSIHTT